MYCSFSLSDFLFRAITLQPDNACLYYNRGNHYFVQKDWELAIADYDHAIALDGNMAEAFLNRGLAYMNAGNLDAGIKDLSKSGELGLYEAYSIIKHLGKK